MHRRLGILLLAVPYLLVGVLVATVLSPFVWVVTGLNWDDQMEGYARAGVHAIEWASRK